MAKITVAGDAVVVTSALKLEDIKTIQQYRPEALKLKSDEDDKKTIFRVAAVTGGEGSINKYGVEFAKELHDGSGLAALTLAYSGDGTDIKNEVAESIGYYVGNLNKVEASLGTVLEDIKKEKEAILSGITVTQAQ